MRIILFMIPFSLYATHQQQNPLSLKLQRDKPSLILQRAHQERRHFDDLIKQHQGEAFAVKMNIHNRVHDQVSNLRRLSTDHGKKHPKLSRALTAEALRLLKMLKKLW